MERLKLVRIFMFDYVDESKDWWNDFLDKMCYIFYIEMGTYSNIIEILYIKNKTSHDPQEIVDKINDLLGIKIEDFVNWV